MVTTVDTVVANGIMPLVKCATSAWIASSARAARICIHPMRTGK